MVSHTGGISNTTHMNSSMKWRQICGHRGQTCGCQGGGAAGGRDWSLGLADAS